MGHVSQVPEAFATKPSDPVAYLTGDEVVNLPTALAKKLIHQFHPSAIMPVPHPKLCLRPQPSPGLQRPKLQHPVLGTLEYINRDGGWWQGTARVAGCIVRVDLQQPANVPPQALTVAARFFRWIQSNQSLLHAHVENELTAGNAHSNIRDHGTRAPRLNHPEILRDLRPYMVVLWDDHVELRYDCDALPDGNVFGAQRIYVSVDSNFSLERTFLMAQTLERRAEQFFERPVPVDASDFVNSLGDQLIAKAATGRLALDSELRGHLKAAISDAEQRSHAGSPECASYMVSVKALLSEIGKAAPTIVKQIVADLRCHHSSGRLTPFKQKLVLAAEDGVHFERSG